MYRIGEFAKRVGRSVSTVRRWEAEGRIAVRRLPSGRRKKFLALMDAVDRGEVGTLVVAHKDRLARFGFDFLEHVAARGGCEIVVANQESLSPQQELVEDLLAIVHTFSCRLYGLRRYLKELKGADLTVGDDR
ncbi:Resolvase, N terminal domain [Micromonospora rhizosphaerae]|uniref:Resolvase, N terminal domain n=1 Tax=Micromonospora rhizosphaerae TaxID=568872 RepID=A0A1C6SZ99_9ACTN|nr:Resolvase, N terminal domain [Micromonospora rhizosphaerae]